MPKDTMKLPITIVPAKGGYCAPIQIGCNQEVAHLLLDTGSSTIAVETKAYKHADDYYLKPTPLAQAITYGAGGWAGPIVETHLSLEHDNKRMLLKDTHIAVIKTEQQDNFYGADGILGLGYRELNRAHDLTEYFTERNHDPAHTYPWPFEVESSKQGIRQFRNQLKQYPGLYPKAFFTQLEEQKISKNKFALYTKRSIVHVADPTYTDEHLHADPLNQGLLILGAGEVHRELYHGNLETIDVVHDSYYNTKLISMQVGDGREIAAPPIQDNYRSKGRSNSIIDCGSSFLVLQRYLYQELMDELIDLDVSFISHIERFQNANQAGKGYFPTDLDLTKWPEIHFYFLSPYGEKIRMSCTPDNYWQINALEHGRAYFMIMDQLKNWPDMSIMGLPLMSDYYCVFDREYDANGVIKVAKVKL